MPPDLTQAIDRFATAVEANSATSQRIALAIQETERRRKRNAYFIGGVGLLLLVLIAAILLILTSIISTQNVIKDCTDRTRATATCARKGEQSTAKALVSIAQGQLTINYVTQLCADREDSEAAFTECVQDELANVKSGKLTPPRLP